MAQKDEAVIQHRFIQIHQTTLLAPDQVDRLWTLLRGPELSFIAISNACDKVVLAVKTGKLDLMATIDHLQHLILVTKDASRLGIFLRTLTRLVLTSPSFDLHPFVWLLRQQPQLYDDLLVETDYCLDQCNSNQDVFHTLVPFFDSVFLMSGSDSSALLHRFNTLLMVAHEEGESDFLVMVVHYLANVCRRYPSHYSPYAYISIVDTVINALAFNTRLHQALDLEDLTTLANDVVYMLLQRAYDATAASPQQPTLLYLKRLQKVMTVEELCPPVDDVKIKIASPNFYLVWCSLSYLLLTASTVDDQGVIVDLMELLASMDSLPSGVLLVALLPLFQTLAELQQDGTKASSDLKAAILGLVATIHANGIDSSADSTDIIAQVNNKQMEWVRLVLILYLGVVYVDRR